MSSTVLALTDVAHGEETGWRRGQHLIDALPYIDTLTPESKAEVESLIKEEVSPGLHWCVHLMPLGWAGSLLPAP